MGKKQMKISDDLTNGINKDIAGIVESLLPGAASASADAHLTSTISIKVSLTPKMENDEQKISIRVSGDVKCPAEKTERTLVMREGQLEIDFEKKQAAGSDINVVKE